MVHLGAPIKLIQTAMRFYDGAVRFFKIGRHCGKTFFPRNGLGQGCALSMRWVNGTGGVWVIKMQCVNRDLRMSVYVDDRTLRASTVGELEEAVQDTITFDEHLGQNLNVVKSTVMATSAKARKRLADRSIDGQRLCSGMGSEEPWREHCGHQAQGQFGRQETAAGSR